MFLHVTLVLPCGKKCFWLQQSSLMPTTGWPNKRDCFNWLEDSSKYSASVLQTNVAKNTSSIAGRGIKSQMLYISRQSCLLGYGDHYIPCFLIIPPCIGLRWCPNAVIIFLIYLSIHTYVFPLSSIQTKTNDSTNSGTSRQGCLPLRHYCMMLLLVLLGFDIPSSDYLAKRLTHLLVKPTEWVTRVLQLIETITYAWSVNAFLQSVLFKPKTFLQCGSTRETCRKHC